jgi:DHA2 family lincomycin resistance protein-like MFS transporter
MSNCETVPEPHTDPDLSASETSDPQAPSNGLVIGLLLVSTFIVLMNEMFLGVALPRLLVDLEITATSGQWLTTGYLLVLAVLIPATGFIMRKYGLRQIFVTSMALFTLGTALAAVAPGFEMLLAGRLVQAVGTAPLLPLLMATVMRLAPANRQGQSMAMVIAVTAGAPALGPAISGLILSQLAWRWLFILILPVAAAGLLLGYFKLKHVSEPRPEDVKLDLLSIALSAVGFGAFVYGVASVGESLSGHHVLVAPWIPIVVGVIGIAAFVRRQSRLQVNDQAVLDVRIFAVARFVIPFFVMFLLTSTAMGIYVIYPLMLSNVHGLSSLQIGFFLVPGGVTIIVMSLIGGRLLPLVGPRPLVIPGAALVAGSLWFVSQADAGTSVATLLAAYIIMFCGQALMWSPLTTMALGSLAPHLYPHGSAAFAAVQQLGGATGIAILISAYTLGSDSRGTGLLTVAQTVSGSEAAFTTAGVIALISLVCSVFVRRPRAEPTHLRADDPVHAGSSAETPAARR